MAYIHGILSKKDSGNLWGLFEPDDGKTTVYKVTPLGEAKLSELGVDIYENKLEV
jgi:hypothetical protein